MDTTLWVGILIGGVLSLIASIVANILHDRIVGVLENRKLATQSNRYAKAAAFYKLVEQLHSGARDKYIFMNRLLARIIIFVTLTFVALVPVGVIVALRPVEPFEWNEFFQHRGIVELVLYFISVLAIGSYVRATTRYRSIANALDDFEEFEKEFRDKWEKSKPE